MKISIGPFSMEFNWDTTGMVNAPPPTINRSKVDIMSIGATTHGGFYVGEVNGNAIILSSIEGQTIGNWYHSFKFAKKLKLFGYNDWVVPSPDELSRIHQHFAPDYTKLELFKLDSQQAFRTIRYWSDREANLNFSYTRNFGSGLASTSLKVDCEGIRVIRRIQIVDGE